MVHSSGPHIFLNCPILPPSVDSVATYTRKIPKITQFSNFEFAGGVYHKYSLGGGIMTLSGLYARFCHAFLVVKRFAHGQEGVVDMNHCFFC